MNVKFLSSFLILLFYYHLYTLAPFFGYALSAPPLLCLAWFPSPFLLVR